MNSFPGVDLSIDRSLYAKQIAVDSMVNSHLGVDLANDGSMHAEQICVSEADESLRALHVSCKNARLSSDERLVQVLGELDCIKCGFVLFSKT